MADEKDAKKQWNPPPRFVNRNKFPVVVSIGGGKSSRVEQNEIVVGDHWKHGCADRGLSPYPWTEGDLAAAIASKKIEGPPDGAIPLASGSPSSDPKSGGSSESKTTPPAPPTDPNAPPNKVFDKTRDEWVEYLKATKPEQMVEEWSKQSLKTLANFMNIPVVGTKEDIVNQLISGVVQLDEANNPGLESMQ
jgi:hypothetical protein